MVSTKIGKAVLGHVDDFVRATRPRTLNKAAMEALEREGRYVAEENINGVKQIVMYWKGKDGTISRTWAGSKEVYNQNGAISTGRYMSADFKGQALFEYKPNSYVDCNYTLTDQNGDTFSGLLMSKEAGGRHIEELTLGGHRISTSNDGKLGHWFGIFIDSIFGAKG